ncbi:MAG TPA: methyltransferase domain-containing protein [Candidatus Limnocylindria bacterium]|nr:methyltransferase domain-containing protein [Candidatus Limnocylindria bacterium]
MLDYSPAAVEQRTRAWLEERFREGVKLGYDRPGGVFAPDGRPCAVTLYAFQLLQRKLKIFRLLDRLQFRSFVDVGAGFEDYPRLVRDRYGAAAYYVDLNHHANLPVDGSESDRLDHAVTASLARLPFPDGAFDVVLCSEVLEHLVRPVEAIAELRRVARTAVIVTSLEALEPRTLRRRWLHFRVDVTVPHIERNFLSMRELCALFGPDAHYESLLDSTTLPASMTADRAAQDAVYARLQDADELAQALCRAASSRDPLARHAAGIVIATGLGAGGSGSSSTDEAALARWLIERSATLERERFEAMCRNAYVAVTLKCREPTLSAAALTERLLAITAPARDRPVAAALLERLGCPDCRGTLSPATGGVRCAACDTHFQADYGVPVLYPRRRRPDTNTLDPAVLAAFDAGDYSRRRTIRRLVRRLRRNERPAGRLRRAVWALAEGRRPRQTG